MNLTLKISLFLVLGIFLTWMLFIPSPAQAYETCCCNVFFGQEMCSRVNINPGSSCQEVMGGYQWSGLDSDCPGDMPDIDILVETSDEIYFTPNAPIPGVFEGKQLVDGSLLSRYIRSFYVYFVWVVGILAAVMTIYAGIQWITAAGDASKITNAKSTMNGAVIGLLLTLGSFVILRTINPSLVSFRDLSIFQVPAIILDENMMTSEKGSPASPFPQGGDVSTIQNVTKWDSLIKEISAANDLDGFYVKAVMMIESRGNPDAVSPAGACGLMQVMPYNSGGNCLKGEATAEQNIRAGVALLKKLKSNACPDRATYKSGQTVQCKPEYTNCTNNWHYMIAAYNGGLSANCSSISCPPSGDVKGLTWWECSENPGYAETRVYVPTVEAMYQRAQSWGWSNE
ncbi:MAG: lytic transglycosylase domain-containing protein [bacterium]